MHEVKFRAWFDGKMHSHEKLVDMDQETHAMYTILTEPQKDITFMQYTGLKDKNGREIYWGDVLEITLGEGSSIRCVIEYKAPSFCRRWIDKVSKYRRPSEIEKMAWNTHIIYKIIGNIYENPELLEVTK